MVGTISKFDTIPVYLVVAELRMLSSILLPHNIKGDKRLPLIFSSPLLGLNINIRDSPLLTLLINSPIKASISFKILFLCSKTYHH